MKKNKRKNKEERLVKDNNQSNFIFKKKHLFVNIEPKTENQKIYIDAIHNKNIIICNGPAGCGKSLLACSVSAQLLVEGKFKKIVLCRPVVEAAGEHLGYLPGTFEEKISPYLRPLYEALDYLVGANGVDGLINDRKIEVIPLAFMRGITMRDAIVILDEAQNTNIEQMKMFLTRFGEGSKFIINGDCSQSDLVGKKSGLLDVLEKFGNNDISDIFTMHMNKQDILRHPVVQRIVNRYEKHQ